MCSEWRLVYFWWLRAEIYVPCSLGLSRFVSLLSLGIFLYSCSSLHYELVNSCVIYSLNVHSSRLFSFSMSLLLIAIVELTAFYCLDVCHFLLCCVTGINCDRF